MLLLLDAVELRHSPKISAVRKNRMADSDSASSASDRSIKSLMKRFLQRTLLGAKRLPFVLVNTTLCTVLFKLVVHEPSKTRGASLRASAAVPPVAVTASVDMQQTRKERDDVTWIEVGPGRRRKIPLHSLRSTKITVYEWRNDNWEVGAVVDQACSGFKKRKFVYLGRDVPVRVQPTGEQPTAEDQSESKLYPGKTSDVNVDDLPPVSAISQYAFVLLNHGPEDQDNWIYARVVHSGVDDDKVCLSIGDGLLKVYKKTKFLRISRSVNPEDPHPTSQNDHEKSAQEEDKSEDPTTYGTDNMVKSLYVGVVAVAIMIMGGYMLA